MYLNYNYVKNIIFKIAKSSFYYKECFYEYDCTRFYLLLINKIKITK